MRSTLLCALVLLSLAAAAGAQSIPPTLELNRELHASVGIGSSMEIRVTTTPGATMFIVFNIDPGPTPFAGMLLPIALNQTLVVSHSNVPCPPSGEFIDNIPIDNNPFIEGIKLYSFCFTFDQGLPMGFGFSNGADLTFVRQPSAGTDTAGLVGDRITLDGSGNLAPGPLPAGFALDWTVANGPAGHAATLGGQGTAFPTLQADLPGTYELECSVLAPGTTGGATDTVNVDVFDLDVTSHVQGEFSTADPVSFAATLAGPPAAAFEVPGVAAGAGGAIAGSVPAGTPLTELVFQVTSASSQSVSRGLTVVNNAGAPLGTVLSDSALTNLRQPLVDDVETALEAALALVDLSGPLTGLPPIPVVDIPGPFGTTLFSADVTLTALAYDPNIEVEITLNAGAAHVQMTINMVQLDFDVNGLILSVPYMDMGILTMSSVVVDFDLTTTVAGGAFVSTTANETATINGANLVFTGGVIGSGNAATLLAALLPVIEGLIASTIPPAVPPLVDGLLAVLPQQIDLAPTLDVLIDLPPNGVDHLAGALTLRFGGRAQATMVDPAAAMPAAAFTTPGAPPVFGATTPGSMLPYRLAFSLDDDLLNQLLAESMISGAFEQTLGGSLVVGGMPIVADAGTFATLFPSLGFDKFDPAAAVTLRLHPTVAPIVELAPAPADTITLHLSDFEIDIEVEVAPGYVASVARVGLNAQAGLSVSVDPMMNTIDLVPGAVTSSAYARNTLPGVDATTDLAALATLIDNVLPLLLTGVGSIPIPDPGIGVPLTIVDVVADGPGGDYLSLYFD